MESMAIQISCRKWPKARKS